MTDSMSDEEIRENLVKLGVNIGPVVDSTRDFYRRKLAKLLGEIKDEPVPLGSGTEDSASENEADEVKEEQVPQTLFSETYTPPDKIRGRRSVHSYADSSPPKSSYRSSPTSSKVPTQAGGEKNTVMMLVLALGIAVILYFTLFAGDSAEVALGPN